MTKDELAEKVAREVHGVLSRANVIAYLDMPSDTATDVARAALAIAMPAAFEMAAEVAQKLTVCTEWWEGLERSVRHPSPAETATAIRAEGEKWK